MSKRSEEFNLLTIVETLSFTKEAKKFVDEKEITILKDYLAANPEVGDLIPGLGGIRKMRWQSHQKGKRGGVRIIYFFYNFKIPLFLLDIYSKSKKEDLSFSEKRELIKLVEELIKIYGGDGKQNV